MPYPPTRAAWYAVVILLLAYVSSIIDRVVLGFLITPIKQTFQVTDSHVSLLLGIAFTLFYTVVGIPSGWLADTRTRRTVAAVGILLWSFATMYCGLAQSYTQLFIGRVLVGVGEATLGPAAYSLLADYFPPQRRAGAFSTYSMGITVGAGLAVVIAGIVVGLARTQATMTLPVIGGIVGDVRTWQYVFFVVGAPGLLIAALMMTVREPERQNAQLKRISLAETFVFMRLHWKTMFCHSVGFGFFSIFNQGVGFWLPEFFVRSYGWSKPDIGQTQGFIVAVCGTLGLVAGGRLTAWFAERGHTDATMRTMMVCAAGVAFFGLLLPFMPDGRTAAILLAPTVFFSFAPYGAATAALQEIVPNQLRGQTAAFFLFTINLIGGGLGPILIATLTDAVFKNEAALRSSILVATAFGLGMALLLYGIGLQHFRASVAERRNIEGKEESAA